MSLISLANGVKSDAVHYNCLEEFIGTEKQLILIKQGDLINNNNNNNITIILMMVMIQRLNVI